MRSLLVVGVLVVVAILVVEAVKALNQSGWIPHKLETQVLLNGDWMAGEFRNCNARAFNVLRPRIDELDCVVGDAPVTAVSRHALPVTYWGRVERRDIFVGPNPNGYQQLKWSWHCQRNQDRLKCWAVN